MAASEGNLEEIVEKVVARELTKVTDVLMKELADLRVEIRDNLLELKSSQDIASTQFAVIEKQVDGTLASFKEDAAVAIKHAISEGMKQSKMSVGNAGGHVAPKVESLFPRMEMTAEEKRQRDIQFEAENARIHQAEEERKQLETLERAAKAKIAEQERLAREAEQQKMAEALRIKREEEARRAREEAERLRLEQEAKQLKREEAERKIQAAKSMLFDNDETNDSLFAAPAKTRLPVREGLFGNSDDAEFLTKRPAKPESSSTSKTGAASAAPKEGAPATAPAPAPEPAPAPSPTPEPEATEKTGLFTEPPAEKDQLFDK